MSAPALLRAAREADLPAIVAIYNSVIPDRMVTADLEPVTVESRLAWFHSHQSPTRPLWVAEKSGTIVAWMSLDTFLARAAYDGTAMVAIYVASEHRHEGLGRWLLAECVARAPTLGLHTLLGYIFAHNAPSLALFESHGFARWAHLPGVAVLDGAERDLVIVGRRLTS